MLSKLFDLIRATASVSAATSVFSSSSSTVSVPSTFDNSPLCPQKAFFGRTPDLQPRTYKPAWPLPLPSNRLAFDMDSLNRATAWLRTYLDLGKDAEWHHVIVRSVIYQSFLEAMDTDEDRTRTLPLSCWYDGGQYEGALHRQHRHMTAMSPSNGHFERNIWKKSGFLQKFDLFLISGAFTRIPFNCPCISSTRSVTSANANQLKPRIIIIVLKASRKFSGWCLFCSGKACSWNCSIKTFEAWNGVSWYEATWPSPKGMTFPSPKHSGHPVRPHFTGQSRLDALRSRDRCFLHLLDGQKLYYETRHNSTTPESSSTTPESPSKNPDSTTPESSSSTTSSTPFLLRGLRVCPGLSSRGSSTNSSLS